MPHRYSRTIRLADTDAAGVVYFARTLSLCHEAYEDALATAGINIHDLLGAQGIIVPIAKSEAEYLRPLRTGDKIRIEVKPEPVSEDAFIVRFEVYRLGPPEKLVARVKTEHVCASTTKRERAALPAAVVAWVKAG